MDEQLTEQQQIEQLKEWWKNNWTSVVFGAVIGLSALGGWRFWQQHQESTAIAASDAFEKVVKLAEEQDKSAELIVAATALEKDHAGTVYAQFGSLYLAREAVKSSDLEKAGGILAHVAGSAKHEAIKHIATVRLGRVRLAQEKIDEALKIATISKEQAGSYYGAYAMLRGDANYALGKLADANAAYAEAKQDGEVMANHPELNLKLDVTTL